MPWRPLAEFRDPAVPKLDNLRRAAQAGLAVPETAWEPADALDGRDPGPPPLGVPCAVRSASPTEDTRATSNAGQLRSERVDRPGDFAGAVARVVAALPRDGRGRALGAVFVQPFVELGEAGVTFFDGFYFEETSAAGSNVDLTAGRDRGEVRRGHLARGDAHSEWLGRVHAAFGGVLDLEWAGPPEDPSRRVLLQARPALFPVRRNETLSLANHKEILGDPPSTWMVGLLAEVGRPVMGYFEAVDPAVAAWEEPYAVELAGRAWLNVSAFFRLMDRWGLPRAMVTEGVGGAGGGPADAALIAGRFARSVPTLLRLQWANLRTAAAAGAGLRDLDRSLDAARTLADLRRVNADALAFAIRTNFAINGMLSGLVKVRRSLGLDRAARLVTQAMMSEYAALAARPAEADRLAGLDAWLDRYGHRGPLESDPSRPRFAELRPALQADLARGPAPTHRPEPGAPAWKSALARPLFLVDERREWFRDRLMRWWQRLRRRVLAEAARAVEAGHLDAVADVFFLRADDLEADPATWRGRASTRRAAFERARGLDLPNTASRDAIEAAVAGQDDCGPAGDRPCRFVGIGLGRRAVDGTAVRADDLAAVLGRPALPDRAVLVVAALEPSWAVAFPRFAAVVAELGGELSHASILLREAGIPAVVNARGAFASIADGEALRVDPSRGVVEVVPPDDAPG